MEKKTDFRPVFHLLAKHKTGHFSVITATPIQWAKTSKKWASAASPRPTLQRGQHKNVAHWITRSRFACHVGPLALERVIIFASIIVLWGQLWFCYSRLSFLCLKLLKVCGQCHLIKFSLLNLYGYVCFYTNFMTQCNIEFTHWSHLNRFWTSLNMFEHIWIHLNRFWTSLNTFQHISTHLNRFWTSLTTFDHIWTSFEQVWTRLNKLNTFEQALNEFDHIWTHLNKFWTSLNMLEHILTDLYTFEQVMN